MICIVGVKLSKSGWCRTFCVRWWRWLGLSGAEILDKASIKLLLGKVLHFQILALGYATILHGVLTGRKSTEKTWCKTQASILLRLLYWSVSPVAVVSHLRLCARLQQRAGIRRGIPARPSLTAVTTYGTPCHSVTPSPHTLSAAPPNSSRRCQPTRMFASRRLYYNYIIF